LKELKELKGLKGLKLVEEFKVESLGLKKSIDWTLNLWLFHFSFFILHFSFLIKL